MPNPQEIGKLMSYMLRGSGGDIGALRNTVTALGRGEAAGTLTYGQELALWRGVSVAGRLNATHGVDVMSGGITGNLSNYWHTGGGADMLSRSLKVGAAYGAVGAVQEGANDGSMWQGFKSHFFRGAVAGAGYSAFKGAAFSSYAPGRGLGDTLRGYKSMYRGYGSQAAVSGQLQTLLKAQGNASLARNMNGLGGTRYSGV